MEPVIRASRLAMGRTVLPVPSQAATVPLVSAVAPAVPAARSGEQLASADPAALRRAIEQDLRAQWQAEQREALALEREAARRDGMAEGNAQGLAEARDAGEAAARAAERALQQAEVERHAQAQAALQSLQQSHAAALAALRDEVGTLAFAAVCRIAGRQAVSRDFVLGIVETVCQGARAASGATLHLHPRDLQLLAGEAGSLGVGGGVTLALVADESLALGGCRVETEAGHFDGSLATQLQRLHDLLAAGPAAD
jgi:flagellar assembly protein FliH